MSDHWKQVIQRMSALGADGKYLPAYTGSESDAELRDLILRLVENCSDCHSHKQCVFRPLKKIHNPTLTYIISKLNRPGLIGILNDECDCRNSHLGNNCQVQSPS